MLDGAAGRDQQQQQQQQLQLYRTLPEVPLPQLREPDSSRLCIPYLLGRCNGDCGRRHPVDAEEARSRFAHVECRHGHQCRIVGCAYRHSRLKEGEAESVPGAFLTSHSGTRSDPRLEERVSHLEETIRLLQSQLKDGFAPLCHLPLGIGQGLTVQQQQQPDQRQQPPQPHGGLLKQRHRSQRQHQQEQSAEEVQEPRQVAQQQSPAWVPTPVRNRFSILGEWKEEVDGLESSLENALSPTGSIASAERPRHSPPGLGRSKVSKSKEETGGLGSSLENDLSPTASTATAGRLRHSPPGLGRNTASQSKEEIDGLESSLEYAQSPTKSTASAGRLRHLPPGLGRTEAFQLKDEIDGLESSLEEEQQLVQQLREGLSLGVDTGVCLYVHKRLRALRESISDDESLAFFNEEVEQRLPPLERQHRLGPRWGRGRLDPGRGDVRFA